MNRRWVWIILSVRSLSVLEENIVVTVIAKSVPLLFKCSCAFFLTRSLIDRCQIVTDICKNNVSKFFWKPFKSPSSLRKWKCFSEASPFNLLHLFSNGELPFTQSKIVECMEDHAVITALNHSGSFGKNFVKFKKNKYVIYRVRVGPYGEKLWPRSQFFTIRTSQPATNIYLFMK